MDPLIKSQTDDRNKTQRLKKVIDGANKRIEDVEVIVYEKDPEGRSSLFDKVFDKIHENERTRAIEEEKLRSQI
jgi:hypothetical protein